MIYTPQLKTEVHFYPTALKGSSEIFHYDGFCDIWTDTISVLTVPIKSIAGNLLRLLTLQSPACYGK